MKYNLYSNSEDNLTVFKYELQSNIKNEPFMEEYLSYVLFFNYFWNTKKSKWLNYITNAIISFESITINSPMKQVYQY